MGEDGVGFIGLGVMGEPMASNLVRSGQWPVSVHDRRPEPVERVAALGATAAGSVAAVVGRSSVVCLSLPGGPELEAVIGGPDGILSCDIAGRVIVDHTTAPVALTRELGAACRAAGAEYCDAPVARTRQAAIDGTLSIMVGGAADAVARVEPVLAAMAADVTRCGEIGAGQVTKLLNNMMLFQNVRALAEAHAIASGLDIDLDVATVFDTIAGASGGSFALSNHGMKAVLPDTYPTEAFSTVYALKDLSYALELAADAGVTAPGAETVRTLMEAARDAGHTDEYFPVMRRML
ncbi:MAG: NAD(P)-dependent oxidoreductase [Actinomycetota bacterium]